MRVNLFHTAFSQRELGQCEPVWWVNFCNEHPNSRLSFAEITEMLVPWNATFNVEYHGLGWRYLEFKSAEDFTAFVLKWA